jgi:hypothetical protein
LASKRKEKSEIQPSQWRQNNVYRSSTGYQNNLNNYPRGGEHAKPRVAFNASQRAAAYPRASSRIRPCLAGVENATRLFAKNNKKLSFVTDNFPIIVGAPGIIFPA